MLPADTQYDRTKPWQPQPHRPWQSHEETLTDEALGAALGPADNLYRLRPPNAKMPLNAPRFGYRTDTLTIQDVIRIDEIYPSSIFDYSGQVAGYSGTSFPALNTW